MTSVAEHIRDLRTARGFTQAELAQRVGAHQSEIARWESGKTIPSGETLLAIQRAVRGVPGPEVFEAIAAGQYPGTVAEVLAETGLTIDEFRRNARKWGYANRYGLPT